MPQTYKTLEHCAEVAISRKRWYVDAESSSDATGCVRVILFQWLFVLGHEGAADHATKENPLTVQIASVYEGHQEEGELTFVLQPIPSRCRTDISSSLDRAWYGCFESIASTSFDGCLSQCATCKRVTLMPAPQSLRLRAILGSLAICGILIRTQWVNYVPVSASTPQEVEHRNLWQYSVSSHIISTYASAAFCGLNA